MASRQNSSELVDVSVTNILQTKFENLEKKKDIETREIYFEVEHGYYRRGGGFNDDWHYLRIHTSDRLETEIQAI